jgi:hypothetical protein
MREVKPALPFGLLPEGIIVFLLSPTKLTFGRFRPAIN